MAPDGQTRPAPPFDEPVFRLEGDMAFPSANAAGPWDPNAQHGGAPSSLVAAAIDAIPTNAPMQVTRLTIDLLRPVPLSPLHVRTEVTREGRNIQVCAASLVSDGKEVVRASALKIRAADLDLPPQAALPALTWPAPEDCPKVDFARGGFAGGMDMRLAGGKFRDGPAALWLRIQRPVIAGREVAPLVRAALTADFSNGVSTVLDFTKWTYINADLTLHLARLPAGEWLLLDAQSWIGPDGRGVAFGGLADRQGYFGRTVQSLVIAPR